VGSSQSRKLNADLMSERGDANTLDGESRENFMISKRGLFRKKKPRESGGGVGRLEKD